MENCLYLHEQSDLHFERLIIGRIILEIVNKWKKGSHLGRTDGHLGSGWDLDLRGHADIGDHEIIVIRSVPYSKIAAGEDVCPMEDELGRFRVVQYRKGVEIMDVQNGIH